MGKEDECWPWTGTVNDKGYGQVTLHYVKTYAHRLAYEFAEEPAGDSEVCHSCDNPPCCNPAHLFLGTHADNMRDMHRKGRWPGIVARGEKVGGARLTEKDVLEIRAALKRGEQLRPMARRYGVSQGCLQEIRRGDSWKHLL